MVGGVDGASVRLEQVRVETSDGTPVAGARLASALGYTYPVGDPPPGRRLVSVGPATLWAGLRQNDAEGVRFDLRAEMWQNGALVASGESRCVADLPHNPNRAGQVSVPFDPLQATAVAAGDTLSLRLLTRLGTLADSRPCSPAGQSRQRAGGLRLYYDAADRPSRVAVEITPDAPALLSLRSDGGPCQNRPSPAVTTTRLDATPPSSMQPRCLESGSLSLAGGNAWSEIATFSLTVP